MACGIARGMVGWMHDDPHTGTAQGSAIEHAHGESIEQAAPQARANDLVQSTRHRPRHRSGAGISRGRGDHLGGPYRPREALDKLIDQSLATIMQVAQGRPRELLRIAQCAPIASMNGRMRPSGVTRYASIRLEDETRSAALAAVVHAWRTRVSARIWPGLKLEALSPNLILTGLCTC